jgi:hypothetical protein
MPKTNITIKKALGSSYSEDDGYENFENQKISVKGLVTITQLLVVGWVFAGMGRGFIQFERDDELASLCLKSDEVEVEPLDDESDMFCVDTDAYQIGPTPSMN